VPWALENGRRAAVGVRLVKLDAVHVDVETASRVDLPKAGLSRYARDPSTFVRVIAYRLPGEAFTRSFDETVAGGPLTRDNLPRDLVEALRDPAIPKWAHNCVFERTLLRHACGIEIPLESTRCTMVHAYSLALPGALGDLGAVLGLSEDQAKLADGKKLIRLFCLPRKDGGFNGPDTHPDEWEQFVAYCARDVDAEVEISRRLARFEMPEVEWHRWHLDQRINARGLPIDVDLVRAALDVDEEVRATLSSRMREITGVENPNSRAQLLAWLGTQGVETESLTKQAVRDLLTETQSDPVVELLRSRLALAKSSTTKYAAIERAVDADDRLRNTLAFMGASRTWRWAGRILQPQNLPQGNIEPDVMPGAIELVKARDVSSIDAIFGDPSTVLSSLIRASIRAPEGRVLVAADYASIESIVLAWLAGCARLLDVFRGGLDVYKDFATELYGIPYAEVTKAQRKFAKPPTLGCGYMLGGPGLVAYADAMGVPMELPQAKQAVGVFRDTYHEIPALWDALDVAARACIRTSEPQRAGRVTFDYVRPFLRMHLPSGRAISYLRPRIETRETEWGPRATITYQGKDRTGAWGKVYTHPGKLTENAVQALARDLLVHGIERAEDAGLRVILHVHDEVIVEADEDDADALPRLQSALAAPPAWALDMPLKTAGFVSRFYRKD
jgi:DNA polymerase